MTVAELHTEPFFPADAAAAQAAVWIAIAAAVARGLRDAPVPRVCVR
jgi:hypothetical protein